MARPFIKQFFPNIMGSRFAEIKVPFSYDDMYQQGNANFP
jgi:hypothetical protein